MSKYIPTLDEIRKPQLCPICGHEIFDDKAINGKFSKKILKKVCLKKVSIKKILGSNGK